MAKVSHGWTSAARWFGWAESIRCSAVVLDSSLRHLGTMDSSMRGGMSRAQEAAIAIIAPFLRVAFKQNLDERWGFISTTGGGIASDAHGFRVTDLRYLASVGVTYSASKSLDVVFGVVSANSFDPSVPAVPFFELRHRIQPGVTEFWLGIPRGASVWHAVTRRVDLGFLANVTSLRFGLHSSIRIADEYRAFVATIGPAARLHVGRGIFLQGEAGPVARRLRFSGADRAVAESSAAIDWYVSVAFGFRIAMLD